jgi:phosphoribosylformylglycinamidine cyclo-ligase
VLPDGTEARLDAAAWKLPPVFRWLAKAGGVAAEEMLRVFNCGIGMALVVSDADAALRHLQGETAWRIGEVTTAPPGPAGVRIDIPVRWLA